MEIPDFHPSTLNKMSTHDPISEFVARQTSTPVISTLKLAGDASDRRFHRVTTAAPVFSDVSSCIVIELGHPIEGDPLAIPFLDVLTFMQDCALPVPAFFAADTEAGLIAVEDFGDVMLQSAIEGRPDIEVLSYYREAVEIIVAMQTRTVPPPRRCIAHDLAFDTEKLMFELDFFYDNAITIYKQAKPGEVERNAIREGFAKIAGTLSDEHRVFTHRDYHSRNIMVRPDGTLALIDFQDARLGPAQYDLVSLLLDSYAALPACLIGELKEYYLDISSRAGLHHTRPHFDKIFDYMTVQRSIKAAGSFAYLDCIKSKNRYLHCFEPVLRYAADALNRLPELDAFHSAITEFIPELS